ncbi:MAG: hypothetical protein ABIA93_01750 [Candidatus Woesearchaeota archaeon]
MKTHEFLIHQLGLVLLLISIPAIIIGILVPIYGGTFWIPGVIALILGAAILLVTRKVIVKEPTRGQYALIGFVFLALTVVIAKLSIEAKGTFALETFIPLVFCLEYLRRGFKPSSHPWGHRVLVVAALNTLMTVYVLGSIITNRLPFPILLSLFVLNVLIWAGMVLSVHQQKKEKN